MILPVILSAVNCFSELERLNWISWINLEPKRRYQTQTRSLKWANWIQLRFQSIYFLWNRNQKIEIQRKKVRFHQFHHRCRQQSNQIQAINLHIIVWLVVIWTNQMLERKEEKWIQKIELSLLVHWQWFIRKHDEFDFYEILWFLTGITDLNFLFSQIYLFNNEIIRVIFSWH